MKINYSINVPDFTLQHVTFFIFIIGINRDISMTLIVKKSIIFVNQYSQQFISVRICDSSYFILAR